MVADGWADVPPAPAAAAPRPVRSKWPIYAQGGVLLLAILTLVWLAKVAFNYDGSFLGSATGLSQSAWLGICLAILLVLLAVQVVLLLLLRRSVAAAQGEAGAPAAPLAGDPVADAWTQAPAPEPPGEQPFTQDEPAPPAPAADWTGGRAAGQVMLLRCKACGGTFRHEVRPGEVFACPNCSRPGHYQGS